jgi:hypothetical protein
MMTIREFYDMAETLGINIVIAKSVKDNDLSVIHLLNPNASELEDALNIAERDLFQTIVIHSNETFNDPFNVINNMRGYTR